MITIKNTQRKIKVNTRQLKKDAQAILDLLDYTDFDLGILITNNKTIHRYNKEYRHQDKPTDILSFPYHQLQAGEQIMVKSPDDENLGDLIIAPEYVLNDLPQWKQTLERRMRILLVHGICHLLGYDHIADADYKIMHKKEQFLLKKLAEESKD
jgi:probable rRNA maturation factor